MSKAPLAALALLLSACASAPRPDVLGQIERLRSGPAMSDAKTHAPSALARAEKLAREADAAFEDDDLAGSQILGEHAMAAYGHARALARIAKAEVAARAAEADRKTALAELAVLEADQARIGAELEALDTRVKVVRDAQPIVPSGPADPQREKARQAAARALALEARLLCGAARLLLADQQPRPAAKADETKPDPGAAVDAAAAALAKLESDLGGSGGKPPAATPIDQATRVRAGCLGALTSVRRAATGVSKAPGAGDALLAELSAAGGAPSRDDRGVFVTLRGLFSSGGASVTPDGAKRLAELGRVAAAHPTFPVLVVIHEDKPSAKDGGASRERAELVTKILKENSAPRVSSELAGAAAPLVDPGGPDRARNARVEVVFITPETL